MKAQQELVKVATGPSREQLLVTAVLQDSEEFASLEEEWDELYRSCPSATPFSSWEWLFSWWEVYGQGSYGLRLITLRVQQSGLLVGLLPLAVRRGRLLLLGGRNAGSEDGMSSYKDVLIREGWENSVANAGARALKEMGGWHVADLQELMPHSAAWHIFREWRGPKTSVPITDYVLIRATPWEELLPSLSRNLRSMARRTLRQAKRDGVRCEPAGPEDAERAASTLVELHRELWRGRRIDPGYLTPRYEAFMRTAAKRMSARGIGRISEFRHDDGVLVSQFLLFDGDFLGPWVIGVSDEASRRYQFMTLCNWDAIEVACERGSAYVSWMEEASPDKLRWADEVVRSHRAILGRRMASFWLPYAGCHLLRDRYYALRSVPRVYVHSEGAPRWVKNAAERYYELLSYPYSEDAPPWVKKATEQYYALRQEYGYYALRYKYTLARARRQIRRSSASHTPTKR